MHVFTLLGQGQNTCCQVDGVRCHRCPIGSRPDFVTEMNNICKSFVYFMRQTEAYQDAHFDVVHAHDWLCANAMIWIKQGRGHKKVLTMHSTEYAGCGNSFSSGRSVRIRDLERVGTCWADKVIAVSGATKNELLWMYEVPDLKVQVIGNGIDWRRFDIETDPGQIKGQYNIAPLDPVIFFCGRGDDLIDGC